MHDFDKPATYTSLTSSNDRFVQSLALLDASVITVAHEVEAPSGSHVACKWRNCRSRDDCVLWRTHGYRQLLPRLDHERLLPVPVARGWDGSCSSDNAIAAGKLCGGVPCVRSITISPPVIEENPCTPHTAGEADLPVLKAWNGGPEAPIGRAVACVLGLAPGSPCAKDEPLDVVIAPEPIPTTAVKSALPPANVFSGTNTHEQLNSAAPQTPSVHAAVPKENAAAPQQEFTSDDDDRLLMRAKSSLKRKDAKSALEFLAEHERRFPNSRNASRREALRAQALKVATGKR